jgi:hypothetical protein
VKKDAMLSVKGMEMERGTLKVSIITPKTLVWGAFMIPVL